MEFECLLSCFSVSLNDLFFVFQDVKQAQLKQRVSAFRPWSPSSERDKTTNHSEAKR